MQCARLYVKPTAAPMGQARENIILGLLKQWWENMRGHNLFLIIIKLKYNTQAYKKAGNKQSKSQETGSEGNFSSLYVMIEVSPPPPWTFPLHPTPPISNLFLLTPLSNSPHPPSLVLGPWWSSSLSSSSPPLLPVFRQVSCWLYERPRGGIYIS